MSGRKSTFFSKFMKLDSEKNSTPSAKKEFDKANEVPLKINKDIYSLAMVSMINPHEINLTKEEKEKGDMYEHIELSKRERCNLYYSAFMVSGIQFTIMFLLTKGMDLGKIYKPERYFETVPRILSCFMMHLCTEAKIRNGLSKMKWILNHPRKFRTYFYVDKIDENDKVYGMKRRVFLAYLLALIQTVIGIWAEIITVFYFTKLTDLMKLIMSFTSLTFIMKFEDEYVNCMYGNMITKATGKKLKTEIKRRQFVESRLKDSNNDQNDNYDVMSPYGDLDGSLYLSKNTQDHLITQNDDGNLQIPGQDQKESNDPKEDEERYPKKDNPRKDMFWLQFLRFIYKLLRTYYVIWAYYFIPISAILYSFKTNKLKLNEDQ